MAVSDSMFLFEVVLENVKSLVKSRELVVKADFANIFSLFLKDPKQLNIVMPQPPPAPPEPPGKGKGKKAKKPPKPKKGKKGKSAAVEPPPPPEPIIQSGQSILIASSAEILLANMKNNPVCLSLWSKENELSFIGSANVTWDPQYIDFLESICNCKKPQPVTVKNDYNIFNEETAKLMATVTFQIKLTYLEDKITSQFRAVPNPTPGVKKFMYTGVHSKQTSYMCSLKMNETIEGSDEPAAPANPHMEMTYVREQSPKKSQEVHYASYKNAPATNTFFSDEADYCCIGKADKPPASIYKRSTDIPDLQFLADYVSKVIRSCNEDMRMLTPQPEIHTKHRATDIDRLCGCHRMWPDSKLAEIMKNDPNYRLNCALCSETEKPADQPNSFKLQNIRGPCGKVECRVAKKLRDYIETLAIEDNQEIQLDQIVGPCGSRTCTIADRIQKFIRQEGVFSSGKTVEGLSTVCACEDKLRESMNPENACGSECTKECASDDDGSNCSEVNCPYNKKNNEFCVGYCTVIHDQGSGMPDSDESAHAFCKSDCPSIMGSPEVRGCTRSRCATSGTSSETPSHVPCIQDISCSQTCLKKNYDSPNDSDVEINLQEVQNPCCVETCDVADRVKGFIVQNAIHGAKSSTELDDPCYCDCECKFGFDKKTTYCGVCGGYEVAGTDLKDKPPYGLPTPACPIYHNLYDKSKFKINPEVATISDTKKKPSSVENFPRSAKVNEPLTVADSSIISKAVSSSPAKSQVPEKSSGGGGEKKAPENKSSPAIKKTDQTQAKEKKKVGKFTFNYGYKGIAPHIGHSRCHLSYNTKDIPTGTINVPKNMGWLWTAEDVPGLKFRPEWRPGAANRKVINLLTHYKNPEVALQKRRQKERARLARLKPKGKLDKKPLLTVLKRDGEYTVTMETMKNYNKQRIVNQYPYEDKAPHSFLVGRTYEENIQRQKRLERRQRRLEREERRYVQQNFKNACEEICMTAYRKALGIQESDETPDCVCYPQKPDLISVDAVWSCSCSDSYSSGDSETDRDEWTLEFTPPVAKFDPTYKVPGPVKYHAASQYSYLDYRVKLIDRNGNPVPRFFKGPDGKEQCSDLGGFWDPNGKWLEIGTDGYIGPDGHWVPNTFIGPGGVIVDAYSGKFQGPDGEWLVIGVDGYVNAEGKWVYVPLRPSPPLSLVFRKPSASTWSCFGDVTPTTLADRGIIGHSRDKKLLLQRLKKLQAAGASVKIPTPSIVPRSPFKPKKPPKKMDWSAQYKCKHPEPSNKGVLSIDSEGRKKYFMLPTREHRMSAHRIRSLQDQGINVCQYHEHCYGSFIGYKELKKLKEIARQGLKFPPDTRKVSRDRGTIAHSRPVDSSAGDTVVLETAAPYKSGATRVRNETP